MSANENAGAAYGSVWLDANRYYDAERRHYEMSLADLVIQAQKRANPGTPEKKSVPNGMSQSSLASEIAFARQKIQNFLKSGEDGLNFSKSSLLSRLQKVETERRLMLTQMSKLTSDLANVHSKLANIEVKLNLTVNQDQIITQDDSKAPISTNDDLVSNECDILSRLEKCESENVLMQKKIAKLESDMTKVLSRQASIEKTMNMQTNNQVPSSKNVKCAIQNGASIASEDDDELDLFGSDEEDAAAAKLKEERLQAYATKKAKKPALIAKSSVILDVKPWDDETDMKAMEKAVRGVQCDGLVWGASKLVPLAYGINKLQIVAIVEDEKVSIDWLQETIGEIEDLVQSVDVAAFNKL